MSAHCSSLIGTKSHEPIPGYVLREKIGEGGYGEVWKADAPGGLQKAVKIVFGHLTDTRASRELRALERIKTVSHPMLLSLERIELVENVLVVVTELAEMSLRDRFRKARQDGLPGIPRDELLIYLMDAADGLDFMYSKHSLQHLDVKPENLLLVGGRVKVADFGLVKDLHDKTVSVAGGLTPLYAPPELLEGRPSQFSDQYSLAILYQEMLTADVPFDGRTPAQIAIQQLQGTPCLASLPRFDQPIVQRALSKNPVQRYENCRAFVNCLVEISRAKTTSLRGHPTSRGRMRSLSEDCAIPADTVDVLRQSTIRSHVPYPFSREIEILPFEPAQPISECWEPTLVLAIGGAGCRIAAGIKREITERLGSIHEVPWLRLLAIDTDSEDLNRSASSHAIEWGLGECLHIPLKNGTEYREQCGDYLQWLSRRWLYNIPRTLRTEGIRPLGRLALVDHYARVQRAISEAIQTLRMDCLEESVDELQLKNVHSSLRVILIGSTSGGTASGALLDVAYAVRSEVTRQNCEAAAVELLLVHGTCRKSSARDLAIANTAVFLREYADLAGPEGRYPGEPSCGIPSFERTQVPFNAVRLIDLGHELNDREYALRLAQLSDLQAREIIAPAGATARELVRRDPSAPYATISSVGIGSCLTDLGDVPELLANALVSSVGERWLCDSSSAPVPRQVQLREIEELVDRAAPPSDYLDARNKLQEMIEDLGFAPEALNEALTRAVTESLGSRPEEYLQQFLRRILNAEGEPQAGQDVALSIRRFVGRGDASEDPRRIATLRDQLEAQGEILANESASRLQSEITRLLDASGPRLSLPLDLANQVRSWLRNQIDEVDRQFDRVDESARNHLAALESGGKRKKASREELRQFRLAAWFQFGLCQVEWAVLRGRRRALQQFLSGADRCIERLLECFRRIRTTLRKEGLAQATLDLDSTGFVTPEWVQAMLLSWQDELDGNLNQQLTTHGFQMSQLLDSQATLWQRLPDLLHKLAFCVISRAIFQRASGGSVSSPPEENPMRGMIEDSIPKIATCGGRQTWNLFCGREDETTREQLRRLVVAQTGHPPRCLPDPMGSILLCCYMDKIPVENVIRHLMEDRPELPAVANRLHARIDIEWSEIR